MSSIAKTRTCLRPCLSPYAPRTTAPTGRETYPTAYVASEAMMPTVGFSDGKKMAGKMSVAASEYSAKS